MAGAAGLEPVTSAVTGQRSNQLSYAPASNRGLTLNQPTPGVNAFLGRTTVWTLEAERLHRRGRSAQPTFCAGQEPGGPEFSVERSLK